MHNFLESLTLIAGRHGAPVASIEVLECDESKIQTEGALIGPAAFRISESALKYSGAQLPAG